VLPSPSRLRARPPGLAFSGPPRVHLRYGPATRTHPEDEVVNGLQVIRFPSCLPSSYGASDCYPDGTNSRWTQQPFLDAQPCEQLSLHTALQILLGGLQVEAYQSVKSVNHDHVRSCPLVGSSLPRVSCSPSLHGRYPASSLLWELCRQRGIPARTGLTIPSDFSGSCLRICSMDVGSSFAF